MPEQMPLLRRIGWALGGPGWQITGSIVVSIGIYYYLPPEGAGLVARLDERVFFGVLTAYGLARLVGGVVDSLADPFVGHYCDRSRSRLGRRRSFMIAGVAPMVAAPALLFWPAGAPGSTATFLWLTALLALYYVFFTVYVGPYLALIPELAPSEADRVELSRLRSIVAAPVMLGFGFVWLKGVDLGRDAGLDAEHAVRLVVVVASLLAFVLCLFPIFAVDEKRFTRTRPSTLPLRQSLAATVRNGPFVIYLVAQIVFILAVTMVGPALPYVVRVILGRDEGFTALLALASGPLAVLGFVAIERVAERLGTRNTLAASVLFMGLILLPLGLLEPDVPGGPRDSFNVAAVVTLMVLVGLPIASFLVLPVVMLGQLIDLDAARTGADRAAMYFGVQGLFTKWAYAASGAILSFLFAQYGRSAAEPDGVLLVGPVAGSLCLFSAALYLFYPEARVTGDARRADAGAEVPSTSNARRG